MVFVLALALVAWAIVTLTRAGSNVPTNLPTTTIVESGPYRFTRNPIYLGMFLGLIGLAIAFDDLWLLMMLVPFALAIRYGVVAREEVYLKRKFGDTAAPGTTQFLLVEPARNGHRGPSTSTA
jgi:protein-S-isoprenylcysteine O-methyltransferase Ste14